MESEVISFRVIFGDGCVGFHMGVRYFSAIDTIFANEICFLETSLNIAERGVKISLEIVWLVVVQRGGA